MELDIKGILQEILREEIGKALNGMTKPAESAPTNISMQEQYFTSPPKPTPLTAPCVKDVPVKRRKGTRQHIPAPLAEAIIADIDAGLGRLKTVKKYNISINTLYRIINREKHYNWILRDYDERTGGSKEKSYARLGSKRTPRPTLSLDTAQAIFDDVRAGMPYAEACTRYDINAQTLGRILAGSDRYAVLLGHKGGTPV